MTLDFRANRWPKMLTAMSDFERALASGVRKRGTRVSPRDLFECFTRRKWDLVCPACGYSFRRGLDAINRASHKMSTKRKV